MTNKKRGDRGTNATTPAPDVTPAEKCDCLIHCGDDPWLRNGRAQPCEHLKKEWAATAKAKEEARQLELSAIAVGEWVDAGCKPTATPATQIAALVKFAKTVTTPMRGPYAHRRTAR